MIFSALHLRCGVFYFFKNGELGTIYTANGYSSDGNNKTSEIDSRGNETKYVYDAATSKPTKVIDRCGNATQYQYDAAGRTTKVTAPNGGVVSYGYNSYDDLTQVTRGDGQGYTMAYDAYRNLTQVKVGGESLVDYTYNSGTNRLKSMTYANGSKQTLTYDRLGRLIVEKWTKGTTVEAHYRYFYDVSNNLEKTLDIFNKRMYNITTDGENVTAIAEYEVTLNGETVTAKMLIGTMHYSFDGEGKQFRKKYVAADGTEQKYVFEFQDEQNVAVQLPTGVVSHSKSDHLGRKVFDELQLGKGLMNRTFTYHAGEITQAHLDNDKVVSNPETTLVKTIEFADGRTIQYEYDAEERITKVIDSVDGTYEYTYDVLGQLLTEKKNGTTINTMTYDGYGNIKTKNGVAYTYDTTWKDKLTSYNGKTITYDAQGNPTNYMGTTLVWEKGRQLKQFGSNTYTYNNESIRTSKTVGGVKHTYVLDGTNIVKETWGSNTLIPLYDLDGTVCGINYNGTAYYFYKNLQGDIVAITNDAGVTVAKYTYNAWGVPTIVSDSSGASIATINPFRYRSYYYDTEIEMYYLQSRYYDPAVGEFISADNPFVAFSFESFNFNLYAYCNNNVVNDFDSSGYASFRTKSSALNKFIEALEKAIPNFYTQDFWCKEKQLLRIGTTNLALTISCGVAAQTNKNALFGGMFKKGALEVSGFFGVSNIVCFSFSAGITWQKAYIKVGLLLAMSKHSWGFYGGAYVELSVPTWLLAVATVAVGVACAYNPAVGAYIAKFIGSIRSSAKVAAASLVTVLPYIVKAAA